MTKKAGGKNTLPPSHPFDESLCALAADMKAAGLVWAPKVGDFVWDNGKGIGYPSPFPHRIYFILNINRFLDIFQTIETMIDQLVWLPAWHQARAVCSDLKIDDHVLEETFCSQNGFAAENDLRIIYDIILSRLRI